jgi:hypothetical protein
VRTPPVVQLAGTSLGATLSDEARKVEFVDVVAYLSALATENASTTTLTRFWCENRVKLDGYKVLYATDYNPNDCSLPTGRTDLRAERFSGVCLRARTSISWTTSGSPIVSVWSGPGMEHLRY